MSLIDAIFGRENADPLGAFDEKEAEDLSLHIRQCGRRYRALNAKLDLVTRLVLLLCGLYVLNNIASVRTLLGL